MSRRDRSRHSAQRSKPGPAPQAVAGLPENGDTRRSTALLVAGGLVLVLLGVAAILALRGIGPEASAEPAGATASQSSPSAGEIPRIEDVSGVDPRLRSTLDAAVERAVSEKSAATIGELGRLYNAHQYLEHARHCYEMAQRLDPSDAEWPYHLGLLAAERGDVEGAIPLLRRVLELRSDYLPARARLGELLLAANRLDEASVVFSAAASAVPDAPWGELGLGKIELRRGAPRLALAHLENAHRLAPTHAETRYLLATVYRDLDREQRAAELLRGLEQGTRPERPPDPLLRRVLDQRQDLQANIAAANALLAAGRTAEAERLYLEVLAYDPTHYDAHYDLGVLYGRSGRYEQARESLEAAVASRPTSADARVTLAMALIALGELDGARREAARALELDPQNDRVRRLNEGLRTPPSGI